MHARKGVTFIIPVGDDNIYRNNLLISPVFNDSKYDIEIQPLKGYTSASLAYNGGMLKSKNDIIVFCHQDMIFPLNWLDNVFQSIGLLEEIDKSWGVLGCLGADEYGKLVGNLFCNANGKIGGHTSVPVQIQTLDEVVLILRKSDHIFFDEDLPNFHFYGSDIVLIAKTMGKKSYAINAPCFHNTKKVEYFPKEFIHCYRIILRKWKAELPIYTTCTKVGKIAYIYLLYKTVKNYMRVLISGGNRLQRMSDKEAILAAVNSL